jgi:hypothetical protein
MRRQQRQPKLLQPAWHSSRLLQLQGTLRQWQVIDDGLWHAHGLLRQTVHVLVFVLHGWLLASV